MKGGNNGGEQLGSAFGPLIYYMLTIQTQPNSIVLMQGLNPTQPIWFYINESLKSDPLVD